MREFQQKRQLKRRIYSKTTVFILVIILFLLIDGTWGVYKKYRESRANLARANKELADLTTRESLLSNDISKLKTDQGVEDEIRSKYDVSKPGEEVVVIVDKNSSTSSDSAKTGLGGWWQKFVKLFNRQ